MPSERSRSSKITSRLSWNVVMTLACDWLVIRQGVVKLAN